MELFDTIRLKKGAQFWAAEWFEELPAAEAARQLCLAMEKGLRSWWRPEWRNTIMQTIPAILAPLARKGQLEGQLIQVSFWGTGWDPEQRHRSQLTVDFRPL